MIDIDELEEWGDPFSGKSDGHRWVDLGLSVLWAECNVGASSRSEYGDYFAWGETSAKPEYTEGNSKTHEKKLGDIAGDPQYDAARANWGGSWRLPTEAEIMELEAKCTRRWTSWGGNTGFEVTGPNDCSIFLPAAGWRKGTSREAYLTDGWYWSSTPNVGNTQKAFCLLFNHSCLDRFWGDRPYGCSVRPVLDKPKTIAEGSSRGSLPAESNAEQTAEGASHQINGHEYVDLGLSVKWAACNVGASSPSDYGDYFAWGETRTKPSYTVENSVMDDRDMEDLTGFECYDAAHSNWGGTWRLPTIAEIGEMADKCVMEWTTMGDHKGCKVTGPNGNSIFIPAAGYRRGESLDKAGDTGYYWSATPYEVGEQYAVELCFSSDGFDWGCGFRSDGQPVRPVSV